MRCLERNKHKFYYCTYRDKEYVLDSDGHRTGDMCATYNAPVEIRASISATTSMTSATRGAFSDIAPYGVVLNYDRRIVVDDLNCPIDELSVLCVDVEPVYDEENHLINFDHEVIKKVKGLNDITYYIKRITNEG